MSVVQQFWEFAQSTKTSLPCSVHSFKTIGRLEVRYGQTRLCEILIWYTCRTDILYCNIQQYVGMTQPRVLWTLHHGGGELSPMTYKVRIIHMVNANNPISITMNVIHLLECKVFDIMAITQWWRQNHVEAFQVAIIIAIQGNCHWVGRFQSCSHKVFLARRALRRTYLSEGGYTISYCGLVTLCSDIDLDQRVDFSKGLLHDGT